MTTAVGPANSPSAIIFPPNIWLTKLPSAPKLIHELTSGKASRKESVLATSAPIDVLPNKIARGPSLDIRLASVFW